MEIKYSDKFRKQYNKAPEKIKIYFQKRLKLFLHNPLYPQLRNHQLTGKLKGYRSINVTGDWRAIFSTERKNDKEIFTFETIGTHSQLYK